MELKSEHKINATREQVYAALNDPEILRQSIPGCESLEKTSDTEMAATVVIKIGPVKAKFKGEVVLSNLVPPESYTITGRGSGGAAGFAKGGADIKLVEDGAATILQYEVKADVGGKLAQLGSRLMDSTARHLSAKFFTQFCELVEQENDETEPTAEAPPPPQETAPAREKNWLVIAGIAAAIVALIAMLAR